MNFIQLCNLMVTDYFKHKMFVDNGASFVVPCLIVHCSILQC
jgi:hypothetical protein